MNRRTRHRGRAGFTLVELLVAMALIIFIMYILAEAFSAGATVFRNLKAVGDMNERLRGASNVLRRYLAADHFEGKKRLSDPSFWYPNGPPREGFFRIWQGTAQDQDEGADLEGNKSFRSTTHHLHFTVRLRGNQRGEVFYAGVPSGSPLLSLPYRDSQFGGTGDVYTSRWAEVAIYLRPTRSNPADDTSAIETTFDPANPGGTGLNLHTLYLRQRLLVSANEQVTPAVNKSLGKNYSEVSVTLDPPNDSTATNLRFNNSADVAMPIRRFGYKFWNNDLPDLALNRSPADYPIFRDEDTTPPSIGGNDVLLTDVVSMDLRVLLGQEAYGTEPPRFISLHDQIVTDNYVMQRPTQFTGNARVFDTWSSRKDDRFDYTGWDKANRPETIPLYIAAGKSTPIRIVAIQITLRIWDSKTKQTRQTSIIQDL